MADPRLCPRPQRTSGVAGKRPDNVMAQSFGLRPGLPFSVAKPAHQPATVNRYPGRALAVLEETVHGACRQAVLFPDQAPAARSDSRQPLVGGYEKVASMV